MFRRCLCTLVVLAAALAAAPADKPYEPKVSGPSDEAKKALARFRVPRGVTASLWAAEPLLAHPVAFAFDERGRCFVAETFRIERGVTDNRRHPRWLDDDLAARTVEDRVAMYKRHLGAKFADYETEHDRVKLVWDGDGDGVADKATVFADGFHKAAQGIGAGVLARKGNVYYTNIPDLWLLKDSKNENCADVKTSLATGFGVHVAFYGHDMHGLVLGPDGRLYFSIGDRGLNVTTKEGKHLFYPDTGAVLRCDPDGSRLEVFATGLRNPQELAFDALGNLFTVDNTSDAGDRARLVQVVEGSDSGWRMGYQYGSAFGDRGPWNAEKLWHTAHAEQPAYVLPPLAHMIAGPSGFCFNPGTTALPPRYKDHFFVCDFRGEAGKSLIHSFAVKPKGATFEPVDEHEFLGGVLATDCDFGPDGAFYVSDWVDGWGLTTKGRIYRFADAEAAKNPAIAEVKRLLAEGFDHRTPQELLKLLEHADRRVRQEAQFALAARGPDGVQAFLFAVHVSQAPATRRHALWGLGQLGRAGTDVRAAVRPQLTDADAEIRAQAATIYGDLPQADSRDLLPLLKDAAPRVRLHAALSLGRAKVPLHGLPIEWQAVVELIADNADRDAALRHAGSLALARFPEDKLLTLAKHEAVPVRVAAVLALRQRKSEAVAAFLDDPEPRVATEAARVLHDVLPPGSGHELAKRLGKPGLPEAFAIRALNAQNRLGRPENALAVARYAARADAADKLRVEAVAMLGTWAKPPRRDRVTGLTQDLGTRDAAAAATAFQSVMGALFSGPNAVRREAAKAAAALGIKEVGPTLLALASDAKRPAAERLDMLRALEALKDARLEEATRRARADAEPLVRAEGLRLAAQAKPAEALALATQALATGATPERQTALVLLGDIKEGEPALKEALDKLFAGSWPDATRLELLEAAAKRPALTEKLARLPKDHREALAGGDVEAGRRVFFTKNEVACLRCHKVAGEGGEVGPELSGIGGKQKREYLLEALVDPNKQIAQGFETVVLTLTNGTAVSGVYKGEDAREVRLMSPEGKLLTVPRGKIEERSRGKSAMPEDAVKQLTPRELRDLVEYLASLK